MDRLFTRRGVMIGAGSVASLAIAEPATAEMVDPDRTPRPLPDEGFFTCMRVESTLLRSGPAPLGVTFDISVSAGMASVNIRSLSGVDAMWGAIESKDPIVCDFIGQIVERIYTESRQTPDIFPKHIADRPADAPAWLSGHYIQCPDCTADRDYYCHTCDDRGCVWETWRNR